MSTSEVFSWMGLEAIGPKSLLDRTKVVVLSSSQGKQPTGLDPWVEETRKAVQGIQADKVLLTSIGMNTWEFTCYLAAHLRLPQICFVPTPVTKDFQLYCDEIRTDFGLDLDQVCFVKLPYPGRSTKKAWIKRDRLAIDAADLVYPVSVNPKGKISKLLDTVAQPTSISDDHRVEWTPSRPRRAYQPDIKKSEREFHPRMNGWLFHWTRASDGPWPGERSMDYYRDILGSGSDYPRSAKKTLERIVCEKTIRASDWRIRDRTKVVAFTHLPLFESSELFTWRKRYSRFRVEPFGIGIHPDCAQRIGIRPVVYLEEGGPPTHTPLNLQQGSGNTSNWTSERESRHLGDVDLSKIHPDEWNAIELPLIDSSD